jgi:general secretion pathway protein K
MKQRGVALVLVLWVLSILMLMAGSFSLTMRRESAGVSGIYTHAQALAQAQAGIAIAQAMLLHDDENKRWRVDGSIYEIQYPQATMRIQIQSHTGKIDINSAPVSVLHHVLQYAPLDKQAQLNLENAILDWRDADDDTRPFGAEKNEYHSAKLHYSPRNKPFRSMEELQMVRGMNNDVLNWMQPLFTVYAAGQTEVEYAVASREVLSVLPEIDVNLLDAYFVAREKSILLHTPMPVIPRVENANQAMTQDVQNTTESSTMTEISVVSVVVEVQLETDTHTQVEVIMEKMDGANNLPFQILTWKNQAEYTHTNSLFSQNLTPILSLSELNQKNDTP